MIVIMMIIASYTDDDDRHYDNDCMQARVLSCIPSAAAPIESRIILSLGAAAAGIFPGNILLAIHPLPKNHATLLCKLAES